MRFMSYFRKFQRIYVGFRGVTCPLSGDSEGIMHIKVGFQGVFGSISRRWFSGGSESVIGAFCSMVHDSLSLFSVYVIQMIIVIQHPPFNQLTSALKDGVVLVLLTFSCFNIIIYDCVIFDDVFTTASSTAVHIIP